MATKATVTTNAELLLIVQFGNLNKKHLVEIANAYTWKSTGTAEELKKQIIAGLEGSEQDDPAKWVPTKEGEEEVILKSPIDKFTDEEFTALIIAVAEFLHPFITTQIEDVRQEALGLIRDLGRATQTDTPTDDQEVVLKAESILDRKVELKHFNPFNWFGSDKEKKS